MDFEFFNLNQDSKIKTGNVATVNVEIAVSLK